MPTPILGLSAFYHDSAATLVAGDIVAAAQEERFTRLKHDDRFPAGAIQYCLREGRIGPGDLEYVAFYDKPFLKFDRLIESHLAYSPGSLGSFLRAMPSWLKTKLHLPREIRRALGREFDGNMVFARHHESHAASAFFPSPFPEACILTLDGVGEWDTASISVGRGHTLELLETLRFPHSLGLLYSAITYFIGFKVNSGEYKVMGLAPYGEPRYVDLILNRLIDLKEDGSFAMDMRYFNYCGGLTMTNGAFDRLMGGPRREPESLLTQREMDLAASVQAVTEEIVLRMARHARRLTGMRYLCLAGGVALNCVANAKLLRAGIFDDIWVQPAAGDAGGSLGAALLVHYHLLKNERAANGCDQMKGALLGPAFSPEEVRAFLIDEGIPHQSFDAEGPLLGVTAQAIQAGAIVGWFSGRMEFGPRALGARSILADARNPATQATLNSRIKFRESFRPFAPSVLREHASDYFDLDHESPYMLLVGNVRPRFQLEPADAQGALKSDPCKRAGVPRSTIPAVTHIDLSARIQTVDEVRHGRFYRLLREFHRQTGCPLFVNTSFNVRGEPLVATPRDAYRCFMATDMDVLVMEQCVLRKREQPAVSAAEQRRHHERFSPD